MAKVQSLLRVSRLPFALLLIAFVLASTSLLTTPALAAAPSVSFAGAVNVSNTKERARWPSVFMDGAGKAHITWLQQADVNKTGRIMYTNNVGGSFLKAVEVARGEGSIDHTTAIAITGGRVHIIASTQGNKVSHIMFGLNGAQPTGISRAQLSGKGKATSTAATVDTAGRLHAAWTSNEGGQYQIYHRIWANGAWEQRSRIVKRDSKMQKYPNLVATNDGSVYTAFRNGDPAKGKSQGTFTFLRWDGSGWKSIGGSKLGSNNDAITLGSDGTNLYGAVENSDSHKVSYSRFVGGKWSGKSDVPGQRKYNNQPTVFGSSATGRGYAVWSRGGSSGKREEVVLAEVTPDGKGSDAVRLGKGSIEGARGASGGGKIGVVYHDKTSSDIWFVGSR